MTMRRGTRADPDPEAFTITYGKGVYRRFIGGDANDETVIAEQQQYVAQSPAPCYVHPGFTMEQWIELKIQIMVYKHIILYVALPPELLYKPAVVNTEKEKVGYLRNVVPEEGGRCKRTDGKKWRCARDVVAPCEKYCDRHLYRGRFRSRKPVEINNINNNNKKMKLKKPRLQPAAAAAAPPTHSPLLLFNAQSQLVNRDLEPITMSNNQMVAMSEADKKWLASSWSIASAVYHHQPPKPHVPPPIPNFPTITPNIDLMNTSWSDIYKNNNNNNSTHDHVYPSRLPRVDEEASCSWWKIDHPEDSSTGQLLQLYPMDWETSSSSSQAYDSPWEFGECSKLGNMLVIFVLLICPEICRNWIDSLTASNRVFWLGSVQVIARYHKQVKHNRDWFKQAKPYRATYIFTQLVELD